MKKIRKLFHYVKMFKRVMARDGIVRVFERVWQTVYFSAYGKKKAAKIEAEIFAAKNSSVGAVVFDECENFSGQKKKKVDVIVCVHNALEDVKKCLTSVVKNSGENYTLIIVDDGSDIETREFLNEFSSNNDAILIRNEAAKGYTYAANMGLKKSSSDYALLLNSDTIVSEKWLDGMLYCAESDNKIGLVGPLSNTASWQSVPNISVEGDWAENKLPDGYTIEEWASNISKYSTKIYPRIPFLNGFCLMIKRGVIDSIGYFDEENFGRGYGEENDYCLRARKAGWELTVADDVYVFHSQSKSYSNEKRKILCEAADKFLQQKHGRDIIEKGVYYCANNNVMRGIRARISHIPEREIAIKKMKERYSGNSVLFVLPVKNAGGGSNIVINEAYSMKKAGIRVELLNMKENEQEFTKAYPNLKINVRFVSNQKAIIDLVQEFDAIIATANFTVEWLSSPLVTGKILGYYIQDYEPFFYEKNTVSYNKALASYDLIPEMKLFTKTRWNKEIIEKNHNRKLGIVQPSFDSDLFLPRQRRSANKNLAIRIAAMIRPSSPRRSAALTMKILELAKRKYEKEIEIYIFGLSQQELHVSNIKTNFEFVNLGILNPNQVSRLFNECDIFVDFSAYQAMGLSAMESMSSGLATIVPKLGGATSFAKDRINALVVDTKKIEDCKKALFELIENDDFRNSLSANSVEEMPKFNPDNSALRICDCIFSEDKRSN